LGVGRTIAIALADSGREEWALEIMILHQHRPSAKK